MVCVCVCVCTGVYVWLVNRGSECEDCMCLEMCVYLHCVCFELMNVGALPGFAATASVAAFVCLGKEGIGLVLTSCSGARGCC